MLKDIIEKYNQFKKINKNYPNQSRLTCQTLWSDSWDQDNQIENKLK
jgi:hypothetical protein